MPDQLSGVSGVPTNPFVLQRVKADAPTSRVIATQRAENVRGAFRVAPRLAPLVAQARLLLVDDVYTSGATAKAASRALLRAGAASVDVLTFARVAA